MLGPEVSMPCFTVKAPAHHQWAGQLHRVGTPFLPGMDSSHFLSVSGFAFAPDYTAFQLKVRPSWGQVNPRNVRDRLVVSMQSSRVPPAVPVLEALQAGVFDKRLCVRQDPHLITGEWRQIILWHKRKSICLAHSIIKNLCLKLLTFGDYSRSASN